MAGDSCSRALERLANFTERLTYVVAPDDRWPLSHDDRASGRRLRLVANGAASSEGQADGLLIAAATAAALGGTDSRKPAAVELAYDFFLGWQGMMRRTGQAQLHGAARGVSTEGRTCQNDRSEEDGQLLGQCGDNETSYKCLPSWSWSHDLADELATGSASAADADAILGMALLVLATSARGLPGAVPAWRRGLILQTYRSCLAHLRYETERHPRLRRMPPNGAHNLRLPRLGACHGGWACVSPSYLAPAHYRAFRDFTKRYAATVGDEATAAAKEESWDALIEGASRVLREAQCAGGRLAGLVPSGYVPLGELLEADVAAARAEHGVGWQAGTASCSVGGADAAEFGAEAARSAWRVGLDAIWFSDPASVDFTERMARAFTTPRGGPDGGTIDADCAVTRWDTAWETNMAIVAPVSVALYASLTSNPTAASTLEWMRSAVASFDIASAGSNSPGAWSVLASLALDGTLRRLAPLLRSLGNVSIVEPLDPDTNRTWPHPPLAAVLDVTPELACSAPPWPPSSPLPPSPPPPGHPPALPPPLPTPPPRTPPPHPRPPPPSPPRVDPELGAAVGALLVAICLASALCVAILARTNRSRERRIDPRDTTQRESQPLRSGFYQPDVALPPASTIQSPSGVLRRGSNILARRCSNTLATIYEGVTDDEDDE